MLLGAPTPGQGSTRTLAAHLLLASVSCSRLFHRLAPAPHTISSQATGPHSANCVTLGQSGPSLGRGLPCGQEGR